MNGQTRLVLEKLNNEKIKTVLNIGYRISSDHTIMNKLLSEGKKWTVLEAWKENCEYMRNAGLDVIECDIRNIKDINRNFDATIWLHGPEHILWEEFLTCRKEIENKSEILTLYQCPIGEYPQGALYNNPYENHVSTIFPNMFSSLGYDVVEHVYGKDEFASVNESTVSAFIEK